MPIVFSNGYVHSSFILVIVFALITNIKVNRYKRVIWSKIRKLEEIDRRIFELEHKLNKH